MDGAWEVNSWQLAEVLAAEHMTALGFTQVRLTPAGADAGLDVVASDAAAQVKHYSTNAIGRPDVQRLRGAAGRRPWALFYSLAGYSMAALEYSEVAHVALFRYDLEGGVVAENQVASDLLRRGFAPLNRSQSSATRSALETSLRDYGQASADAATVALHVLNKRLAADVDAVRAGRRTSFVTAEDVPELMRQALGLQSASQWAKDGDEQGRSLGDWADGLLDLEALVQAIAARAGIEYEDTVRAGRTLRSSGLLGRGIASDRLPVEDHLAAARSFPAPEQAPGLQTSGQGSPLPLDW